MSNKDKKITVPRFKASNGFYTTKSRSALMAKIKAKETKPEIIFRKALWSHGLRYRKYNTKLPGNPDVVIQKYKVIVFVDGEFWHGYNWTEKKNRIKTNREFWIPKIERNMQRDNENNVKLAQLGYKVFRFWEHQIKKDINNCILEILDYCKH